jgi:hypothetical protein
MHVRLLWTKKLRETHGENRGGGMSLSIERLVIQAPGGFAPIPVGETNFAKVDHATECKNINLVLLMCYQEKYCYSPSLITIKHFTAVIYEWMSHKIMTTPDFKQLKIEVL